MLNTRTGASNSSSQTESATAEDRLVRQLQLVSAGVVVLMLLQWSWIQLQRPVEIPLARAQQHPTQLQIDLNSADWIEWMQVDGIGPELASRIVADRQLHGSFQTPEELLRVSGIGPATLNRIRPFLEQSTGPKP
jgi:competence protein ComEA